PRSSHHRQLGRELARNLARDDFSSNRHPALALLVEHDLFPKTGIHPDQVRGRLFRGRALAPLPSREPANRELAAHGNLVHGGRIGSGPALGVVPGLCGTGKGSPPLPPPPPLSRGVGGRGLFPPPPKKKKEPRRVPPPRGGWRAGAEGFCPLDRRAPPQGRAR